MSKEGDRARRTALKAHGKICRDLNRIGKRKDRLEEELNKAVADYEEAIKILIGSYQMCKLLGITSEELQKIPQTSKDDKSRGGKDENCKGTDKVV